MLCLDSLPDAGKREKIRIDDFEEYGKQNYSRSPLIPQNSGSKNIKNWLIYT